ncbi:MAG: UDP-N-acetylglucosamine 2-epimerase [Candidatus Omnitrophota bacterium]
MRKKIAVVTSSRAEYGLLYRLLKRLRSDKDFKLQLIATGAHLSAEFGNTVDVIKKDGFSPVAEVDVLLSGDSPASMAKSTGIGICGFSDIFTCLKPDILLVLGDRFEIFSAAYAAKILGVPIIHISGGDTTAGAIDDVLRHSISLMSALHFVKLESHKQKLINLGVNPLDIHIVGYLGLENAACLKAMSKTEIEDKIGMKLRSPMGLITFHPVTNPRNDYDNKVENLLTALSGFKELRCVFTAANEDSGGRAINRAIESYCRAREDRSVFIKNLGQKAYLSLMARCDVVVGNSSSGILESGFFKAPVVNIEPRESGRLKNNNVIGSENKKADLICAIRSALSDEFRRECGVMKNIYEVIPAKDISAIILAEIKRRFNLRA